MRQLFIAAAFWLYKAFQGSAAATKPFGCFADCHIPCSSPPFRSGSYLCPAHPLHSLLPQFRFITFHSQAPLFCTCHMVFIPLLQLLYTNTHIADAILSVHSTAFHFLCHTFISVGSIPPAAHNLACLAACLG
jgi:hypothetical protein